MFGINMPIDRYEAELALKHRYFTKNDRWACRDTVKPRIVAMGHKPQIEQLTALLNDSENIRLT